MVSIVVQDALGYGLQMGRGQGPLPVGIPEPELIDSTSGPFNFRSMTYSVDADPIATVSVFGGIIVSSLQVTSIDYRGADGTTLIALRRSPDMFSLGSLIDDRWYAPGNLQTNDIVTGASFDDRIIGCGGRDRLTGNGGDDSISGGRGKDRLFGGAGADTLADGTSSDTLAGGSGADVFVFTTDFALDTITDFEVGTDRIDLDVAFRNLTIETVRPGHVVVIHDGDVLDIFDAAGTLQASDLSRSDFI